MTLISIILAACQTTAPQETKDTTLFPVVQTNTNINSPKVELAVPDTVNEPKTPTTQLPHVVEFKPIGERLETTSSPLINKQVCRDNIDVSYFIIDRSANRSDFKSKVQAQALVVAASLDQIDLKLKITGWHSNDETLSRWQPYLKKEPLTKSISLEKDAIVWDKSNNWYKCNIGHN